MTIPSFTAQAKWGGHWESRLYTNTIGPAIQCGVKRTTPDKTNFENLWGLWVEEGGRRRCG